MIRVFEAFAGIGTQRMALKNIGVEHEVVGIMEIDKFAIKSYEAIHGEVNNLGDISKVKAEDVPDHDLFTYSFPCQDISVAGRGKGLSEGGGTRSGLLWECERIIEHKKPKYLLMENVKNLVGKKFKSDFGKWLGRLGDLGYTNYWQVLNAKDYGIPQNRERVFCVSVLGEHTPYEFPKGFELKLRLKDMLEDEVEEKFYLSKEQLDRIKFSNFTQEKLRLQEKDYSEQGGWRQPSVLIKNGTKRGYLEATEGDGIDLAYPKSKTRRGRVQKQSIQTLDTSDNKGVVVKPYSDKSIEDKKLEAKNGDGVEPDKIKQFINDNYKDTGSVTELPKVFQAVGDRGNHSYSVKDISNTIPANAMSDRGQKIIEPSFRIRKLTPKECWRLMGCTDEDFEKAQQVNSNTQLYKQAGNAIVVDVLEAIFNKLFIDTESTENKGFHSKH